MERRWHQSRDRAVQNIRENRAKWMNWSRNKKGNRANLKQHMNCEFETLIKGDDEDPIIKTIPPPPIHTMLLGPVNHLFKQLLKRHPKILNDCVKTSHPEIPVPGRNFEGKHP